MRAAAAIFDPLFFPSGTVRLRGARFDADPAAPFRGILVLLNGQTEFIEKYFEVIDELRGRGFAVATMDWRGQGGSDRLLPDDSRKGYVKDFAEYDADLAAFMAEVVAPMGDSKPVALAHSMGGHNLLRYLAGKPNAFAKAVLTAPMVAVSFRGYAAWVVHIVTKIEALRGNGAGWVWGMEARDPHAMTFANQMVTSDEARFARTQKIPVLDVGTAARIRSGAIRVLPGIAAVTADGAIFADGSEGKFDAIVFATGYRPNYRSFLEADRAETDPTIHFVGFRNPVTGSLREISREANRVAGGIATAR